MDLSTMNSLYPYDTINTLKSKNPRPRSTANLSAPRAKNEIHQTSHKTHQRLTTETIQSAALALEGVDNIEGGNCLSCEDVSIVQKGDGRFETDSWHAQCM